MWYANSKLHNARTTLSPCIMKPVKRQITPSDYLDYYVTMLLFILLFFCRGRNCMNTHTKAGLWFSFSTWFFLHEHFFKLEFFLHERCINDGNMICLKLPTLWPLSMIVYMCSSLLQLAVESRDLSQTEKKITAVTSWANSPNNN